MPSISYHDSVKEAITQALLILMEHMPYEEISVSLITRRAGVGRSSFYRNYIDKDDVLEQYITHLFSESRRISNPYSDENLRGTICRHYELYYENRAFLKTLHKNRILYRFISQLRSITEAAIADNDLTINVYQPAFFSAANIGVLAEWLERDCRETPEEIAEIVITLLFRTPSREPR